jgi:uncharacterized phiE125 gp8 family phage protein
MASMNLVQGGGPILDLSAAKDQCRVDLDDEDFLIQDYIEAATDYVQNITGRQFLPATWRLVLDGFPRWIDVPKAPLRSVTSITYADANGLTQTLPTATYVVSAATGPQAARGRITLAYGQYWPVTRGQVDSVTVLVEAGYENLGKVPIALKHAVKILLLPMYERRGLNPAETLAFESFIAPYRTWPVKGC